MEMKQTTFIAACKQFFGLQPNQTLQQFLTEVKQLTVDDRSQLIEMFKSIGIDASKTS